MFATYIVRHCILVNNVFRYGKSVYVLSQEMRMNKT